MHEIGSFLPAWPPALGELALFGALLNAGLLEGVRRGYLDAGWLRGRLAASGSLPEAVR